MGWKDSISECGFVILDFEIRNPQSAIKFAVFLTKTMTVMDSSEQLEIETRIVGVLKSIFDPEIPVNIYDLGLVYGIDADPTGVVVIRMTLTSPGCPVAGSLPPEVEAKVRGIPGVTSCRVELVWDPPWNPSLMSEAARLQLGFF